MLYYNENLNSIVFDEKDFEVDKNYLPLIIDAFTKMDPQKTIYFIIDLPKTPAVFVWYLAKVVKESGADIEIYHQEDSEDLRNALVPLDIKYRKISEIPEKLK